MFDREEGGIYPPQQQGYSERPLCLKDLSVNGVHNLFSEGDSNFTEWQKNMCWQLDGRTCVYLNILNDFSTGVHKNKAFLLHLCQGVENNSDVVPSLVVLGSGQRCLHFVQLVAYAIDVHPHQSFCPLSSKQSFSIESAQRLRDRGRLCKKSYFQGVQINARHPVAVTWWASCSCSCVRCNWNKSAYQCHGSTCVKWSALHLSDAGRAFCTWYDWEVLLTGEKCSF